MRETAENSLSFPPPGKATAGAANEALNPGGKLSFLSPLRLLTQPPLPPATVSRPTRLSGGGTGGPARAPAPAPERPTRGLLCPPVRPPGPGDAKGKAAPALHGLSGCVRCVDPKEGSPGSGEHP